MQLLLIELFFALWGAALAKGRNWSQLGWGIACFCLSLVAVAILALQPKLPSSAHI
jgi:hypothetical protein